MDLAQLSTILAAVAGPPEAIRTAAVRVRVRVERSKDTIESWVETFPPTSGGLEELSSKLRASAGPGDRVRIEWIDGGSKAINITGTGATGVFRVPIPHQEPTVANPAPPAPAAEAIPSTRTAPPPVRTGTIPGTEHGDPGAPLERVPEEVRRGADPEAPAGRMSSGELVATMAGAAAAVRLDDNVNARFVAFAESCMDRLERTNATTAGIASDALKLAQVTVGQVGHMAAPMAQASGRMAEALSGGLGKAVDAAAANASHIAEVNGELLADARNARAGELAAVAAAEPGPVGETDAEGAAKDPAKVLDSVGNLMEKGAAMLKGAGKEAAEGAVSDMIEKIAAGGAVPEKFAATVRGLSAEKKAKVMAAMQAALMA